MSTTVKYILISRGKMMMINYKHKDKKTSKKTHIY